MSDKIDRMKAALALEEAEQAFREKKASGKLTNEDKLALRQLREDYRMNLRAPVTEGAAPAGIGTKAKVE